MPPLHRILIARLRGLFRRDAVAGEIRDELEFHVAMRAEQYARHGATPEEAMRQAARRVGNLALLQDRGYDVRGGGVMETVLQDIRYSVRLLRKQPGFSVIAILTLAFGIGVSTALFSVIDAALLRPLPYPHPEQLVTSRVLVPQSDGGKPVSIRPSLVDASDWRGASRVVSGVGVMKETGLSMVVDAGSEPERAIGNELADGYLAVCGVAPILGRDVTADDLVVGAPPVVLLGYGYWQSRFGGDPGVIGKSIRIARQTATSSVAPDPRGPATIVGVLPANFHRKTAIWRAYQEPPEVGPSRRGMGTETVLRLREAISLADAERELTELTQRAAAERGTTAGVRVQLKSFLSETTAGYGPTVTALTAAVALILLIACVNVAGLLLARGTTRRSELAIRASIGAGRRRLVRQLLTESIVLAIAGGSVGAFLTWISLDALVAMIPMTLPSSSAATMNWQVLVFSMALSVTTSIVFGLVPAFTLSGVQLSAGFGGGHLRHGSALSRRGGQLLIAIEVALAVVLLAGAGLFVRSLARTMNVGVGFDASTILTMDVMPVEPTAEKLTQYYPALLDAVRKMPGVAYAGAVDGWPLANGRRMTIVQAAGRPTTIAIARQVSAGYVEALGLKLTQGRIPAEAEWTAGPTLALMSERAAVDAFPDGSAVGRTITVAGKQQREIVGVVQYVRPNGPLGSTTPEILTLSMRPIQRPMTIVVRPVVGARISAEHLRQAALSVGPKVFVERIRAGSDWVSDSVVTPRRRTLLFTLLGGLGLVLTLVGIFGTTAYAVARRTQEIGVRMAFGARPGQVVRTIVADAAWPVAIGLAIGLGGAMLSTKVIAKFLFQTTPTDPATFAAVAVTLAVAALFAAWLPARRAARVDPVTALRAE